ncbi:MAG: thermonuclease family protein [Gammaproteobacteria bacterium]|nr:thermonuclease family protein [Gammaproteobacteria bacterium]
MLFAGTAPAVAGCLPEDSEPVAIRYVHDGDTVFLDNDEKVRLIGIDTPELGRDDRPPDPGAVEARNRLRELVAVSDEITLRRGIDDRDKYGRLLAHVYAEGRNLQAQLLAEGLAVPLTIPPNLTHLDCYRKATAEARAARHGLWALDRYQPRPADTLSSHERGYYIVTGEVQRIGRSRCCVWLNLDDDFALRIERESLPLFEDIDFDRLEGTPLEARGYLYLRNDQLRMQIRHPADLVIGD